MDRRLGEWLWAGGSGEYQGMEKGVDGIREDVKVAGVNEEDV